MEWKVSAAPTLVRRITDPIAQIYMELRNVEESKKRYYDIDTDGMEIDRIHSTLVRQQENFKEVKNDFLNGFAWRSMTYFPIVILLVLSLYVIGCMTNVSVPLLSYGSSIQVIGGIILGRGLISEPVEIINQAGIPYGGISSYFAKSLATDAADGIWGIFLVLLGATISGLSTVSFG